MTQLKKMIRKIIPYSVRKRIKEIKKNKKVNIYKTKSRVIKGDNIKKVSVVIPNYNYEKFIEERIDSVLFQTYPIHELIILDDASTDNSVKVIKKKIKDVKFKNIKLIVNEKNGKSVFSQWQKAFKEATGDYVWIAEADDSCNKNFLKEVMKGFEDANVVLSYSESKRIDENNNIISSSCRDWMEGVSKTHWNKSFYNNGILEIKNSLSICNTIPNVSAVVFKKSNQVELIEEAKKFKISGDWYIYFKLLETGDIYYCSKSLNYFRKHSNSTSTVAKKEVELEEVLIIQQEIRNKYKLDSNIIERQGMRYGNIKNEVDKKFLKKVEPMMAKKIAWIIPYPIKGSGGIRTMIQNANFLSNCGFECDIYVEEDYLNTNETLKQRIIDYYGECNCNVYVGICMRKQYDMIFATYSILTADYVYHMENVKHKAYFIQDFEPWFEPMGQLYLDMEKTYKYGLQGISIGKWLAHKINTEYNSPMAYFPFCADLNVYKKIDNIEKENAICFIYQPEKARRCSTLGLSALCLVKELRPNVKIYLYGSDTEIDPGFDVENLKIISINECNELYNKCNVGLCISASNPSRIPFEMMASGLPVVDLYRENNLYDIPDAGVLLADSTPEAIATAIIKILDDSKLQNTMSQAGNKYMQDYPLEKGYEEFLNSVNAILNGEELNGLNIKKMYNKEKIVPSKEVLDINYLVKSYPIQLANTSKNVRFLVRTKRFLIRKYKNVIKKVFRV